MNDANQVIHQPSWSPPAGAALGRFHIPYAVVVLLLAALVAAEQLLELKLSAGLARPNAVRQAVTFVIMLVYLLLSLHLLRTKALQTLLNLRPIVLIDDEAYDRYARLMLRARPAISLALLVIAAALGVALVLLDAELVAAVSPRPAAWAILLVLTLTWTAMAWLLLALLYVSIRQAQALGGLARCPLAINIYDPSRLLPFGRLSLWHGLVITGLAFIPLILLGMPTQAGYLVVGFSVLSLLSVFIPLWGVHEQMSNAKTEVLQVINRQLLDDQTRWLDAAGTGQHEPLAARIDMLLKLRKMATDAPSWPFRSEAAVARAALAAASPLIYFILNQLILKFWLGDSLP